MTLRELVHYYMGHSILKRIYFAFAPPIFKVIACNLVLVESSFHDLFEKLFFYKTPTAFQKTGQSFFQNFRI